MLESTPLSEEVVLDKNKLSPKDKRYLQELGFTLIKDLLRDFPDELPDAFLLPETSACPLTDLLEPILDKICRNKGKQQPTIFFYNSKSQNPEKQIIKINEHFTELGIVNPKLVILDDYASISAKTINAIRSQFRQEIPAYVFIGETYRYNYPQIKVGADVSSNSDLRGGFDYRNQKLGAKFLETEVNPVKDEMRTIGIAIANSLSTSDIRQL